MSRKGYKRNKIRTAFEFVRRIRNWPAAWRMKAWPDRGALRFLNFRDGLPESVWDQVRAFAFELHDDPQKMVGRADFLAHIERLGFRLEREEVISYFAQKR